MQTGRRGRDGHRGGEDSRGRGGTETGRVWDVRGRQSDHWQTLRPHIRAQTNRDKRREPGLQRGGNKASNKPLIENIRGGWGGSGRDSQPHRRGRWRDPWGPRACTSPPTREPAQEGPNLIVGSGGSD